MEEKYIFDKEAGELINLRDVKGVWIYEDYEADEDYSGKHTLQFDYYGKSASTFLHYKSSKLVDNAFVHYTQILKARELDVSSEPLTL